MFNELGSWASALRIQPHGWSLVLVLRAGFSGWRSSWWLQVLPWGTSSTRTISSSCVSGFPLAACVVPSGSGSEDPLLKRILLALSLLGIISMSEEILRQVSLFDRGRAHLTPQMWAQAPSAILAEGKQACGLDSEQADERGYFITTIMCLLGSGPVCTGKCSRCLNSSLSSLLQCLAFPCCFTGRRMETESDVATTAGLWSFAFCFVPLHRRCLSWCCAAPSVLTRGAELCFPKWRFGNLALGVLIKALEMKVLWKRTFVCWGLIEQNLSIVPAVPTWTYPSQAPSVPLLHQACPLDGILDRIPCSGDTYLFSRWFWLPLVSQDVPFSCHLLGRPQGSCGCAAADGEQDTGLFKGTKFKACMLLL